MKEEVIEAFLETVKEVGTEIVVEVEFEAESVEVEEVGVAIE